MSTPPEQPQPSQSPPPSDPVPQPPAPQPPAPQPAAALPPAPVAPVPQGPAPQVPAQPSAYPYPSPQSPGGYGPPPPSIPSQQNPYAQPQPGPYAPPPPAGAGGGAGRAILWAVVGAVFASALWAGGVFLLGGDDSPSADLRGYETKSDLCAVVDYSSFENEYPEDDTDPLHKTLKADALDESYCSIGLKKSGSSYSDAYFSVQVDLHKATDPAPEFSALWENYGDRYEDYKVEKISGFGDEAYLVTEDTTTGSSTSGTRAATLAVRDGWMTYQMTYDAYLSSYDTDKDPPEISEVTEWLKTDSRSTLEKLKTA